jgi:SAM-dependent methyltransferase
MLAIARRKVPRGVGLRAGRAEELPFKDGWFERATMTLVVHLVDRARALPEVRRILAPDGRLAIATFDPDQFDAHYLSAFFPSIPAIDRARFPTAGQLTDELTSVGFGEVEIRRVPQLLRHDRATALGKIRGKHISTFQLLPDEEYRAGLARAEAELPDVVEYPHDVLVVTAVRQPG